MSRHAPDLTGRRFGRLIVLRRDGSMYRAHAAWLCRCECGTQKRICGQSLVDGRSRSCGCQVPIAARQLMTTHGRTGTKEHIAWQGMRARCSNPKNIRWSSYGGRGIRVCTRWRDSFESFLADMGMAPSPKHSIDRIDNNAGYEPGNCRWATASVQAKNRRPFARRQLPRAQKATA